ncbi:MAG: sigma 54-interacting transcriptional regulator [Nannocystaceae bacterium]|nr:sigma 54-interacting transcriptional regulator [Nannocystaceae bacterium]
MASGLFETQSDDDGPSTPNSLSLVFIGSAEDGFVDAGKNFAVDGVSRIRFGRTIGGSRIYVEDDTAGIRIGIPHPWVSGEQCQVEFDWSAAPTMSLRDLRSRNGTRVENNQVVGTAGLRTGQVFEVGRTFWMLRPGPPDSNETPPTEKIDPLYGPLFSSLGSTLLGVAASDVPVLVLGETGTGKERLARVLHEYSGRRGEFVPMRLGAYSDAELPGALVGSRRSSVPSLIDRADGGTLFLTDVASLSPRMQARLRSILARALEGRGRKRRDIRLVSASAVDLRRLVDERQFRPELYARLAGVELALPPLRSRRDRLGAMIRSFAEARPHDGLRLSTRAFRYALSHRWPYNIRELRYALTAAQNVASDAGRINLAALEEVLRAGEQFSSDSSHIS